MALTYYNHKNLSKFERKPEYELYSKNENNPLIQLSSRVKSISNIVKRSAGTRFHHFFHFMVINSLFP
jgi:chloramphenicol O-acetyltransferase